MPIEPVLPWQAAAPAGRQLRYCATTTSTASRRIAAISGGGASVNNSAICDKCATCTSAWRPNLPQSATSQTARDCSMIACATFTSRIEIAQGAVGLDAGNADDADIDLELADEIDGRLADDAAVAAAHHTAGDDHFALRVVGQNRRYIQVVGHHVQAGMLRQRARHRFGVVPVVPMLISSELPGGTRAATAPAMQRLASLFMVWRRL